MAPCPQNGSKPLAGYNLSKPFPGLLFFCFKVAAHEGFITQDLEDLLPLDFVAHHHHYRLLLVQVEEPLLHDGVHLGAAPPGLLHPLPPMEEVVLYVLPHFF